MANPVYVSLEFTPNPSTLKYSVSQELLSSGSASFRTKGEADQGSPLASKLFEIDGITGVMIGRDFVTVTKSDQGDWDLVHKKTSTTIEDHLNAGEAVVKDGFHESRSAQGSSEGAKKIREIIENEIRPAVAMDGGDIVFEKFEEGIVYLSMMGSCAGCPSSTMTLKVGIENRLKELVPGVKEVVSV